MGTSGIIPIIVGKIMPAPAHFRKTRRETRVRASISFSADIICPFRPDYNLLASHELFRFQSLLDPPFQF